MAEIILNILSSVFCKERAITLRQNYFSFYIREKLYFIVDMILSINKDNTSILLKRLI